MKTPLGPEQGTTPGDPGKAPDRTTRRLLWILIAVAGAVALTHESLTVALANAHRDSALQAAHTMLTWPLPMTQPILAGVGAFGLLGMAVPTNAWRQVTARQSRLLLGFAIAAILGAAPEVFFVLLTVLILLLVITFGLIFLLVLLLLRIAKR